MEILRAIGRQNNDHLSGLKVSHSILKALEPMSSIGIDSAMRIFETAIQESINDARDADISYRELRLSSDPTKVMHAAQALSAQRAAKVLAERISKQPTQQSLAESGHSEALSEYMNAMLEVRRKYRGY